MYGRVQKNSQKVRLQVLNSTSDFIFYANPGTRIPKALLSQGIIVSKYLIPNPQYLWRMWHMKNSFFFFPVKIPLFQIVNSFNEIMATMKQNHFNELLK